MSRSSTAIFDSSLNASFLGGILGKYFLGKPCRGTHVLISSEGGGKGKVDIRYIDFLRVQSQEHVSPVGLNGYFTLQHFFMVKGSFMFTLSTPPYTFGFAPESRMKLEEER